MILHHYAHVNVEAISVLNFWAGYGSRFIIHGLWPETLFSYSCYEEGLFFMLSKIQLFRTHDIWTMLISNRLNTLIPGQWKSFFQYGWCYYSLLRRDRKIWIPSTSQTWNTGGWSEWSIQKNILWIQKSATWLFLIRDIHREDNIYWSVISFPILPWRDEGARFILSLTQQSV